MSWNISRDKSTNVAAFNAIRTKATGEAEIQTELFFNNGGPDASNPLLVHGGSVTYVVRCDSADPETKKMEENIKAERDSRKLVSKEEQEQRAAEAYEATKRGAIERAREVIERGHLLGQKPLTQNKLRLAAGIKSKRQAEDWLTASTPEDPRPWVLDQSTAGHMLFYPIGYVQTLAGPLLGSEVSEDEKKEALKEAKAKAKRDAKTQAELLKPVPAAA